MMNSIAVTAAGNGEFRRGWRALLAAVVGMAFGLTAIPYYSLSSFMAPLHAEFGWSVNAIGAAGAIVSGGNFVTGPFVGYYCDRLGVRPLALISILLLAVTIAGLCLFNGALVLLYGGYTVVVVAGAATTAVAYSRVVNTWFDKSRGLALGITMAGTGVTAFLLPLILHRVIAAGGWRAGYLACAVMALIPLPLVWWLLHERRAARGEAPVTAYGMTRAEAMRTGRFWMIAGGASIYSTAIGAVMLHIQPILSEIGWSGAGAAGAASMLGLGIIGGRFLSGSLLDRFHGPRVALVLFTLPAIGYLIFYGQLTVMAPLAVFIIGLSVGVEGDTISYFTARYFGLKSYSELFGWMFGFMCIAGAIGPLLLIVLKPGASYRPALLVFAAFSLTSAALLGTLGAYPNWDTVTVRARHRG
jgi:MFS family permease